MATSSKAIERKNATAVAARAHWRLVDSGLVPREDINPVLADSWQRSLDAGLDPGAPVTAAPHASAPALARARERHRELIDHALPTLAYLQEQTRDTGSVIVLSNADGLLLQACGDTAFLDRSARVHLAAGASWHEAQRGTNAIGTTLALQQATVITGSEHFMACNGFLTCAAAPISDSRGRLLGALDISGDHRSRHPHTFGLVRAAAQMIENRLFLSRHGGDVRLRFHPLAEGVGTLAEGVIALSRDGWVVGGNPAGMALLNLGAKDFGGVRIDQLLGTRLEALIDWSRQRGDELLFLPRRAKPGLFVRVEMARPATVVAPGIALRTSQPAVCDALAELDSGDERMRTAITRARRVMDKAIPLLIQGESGAGKELFAKAVHRSGPRAQGPFVAVNCAALPETLIEAELFGYAGGAYTGARREGSPGRIREADGGTLLLDEIGDMPLAMQARLLRVLQERVVQPLGSGRAVPVDFALICATHCQLKDAVDAGRFRTDLYYRVNGLTLILPPLRERRDFSSLIATMLDEIEPARKLMLAPSVAKAFAKYRWPGNLRQLANTLRSACAMLAAHELRIEWEHLPEDLVGEIQQHLAGGTSAAQTDSLNTQADQTILRCLEAVNGNMAEASRRLGISRNTLYRRVRKIGTRR